MVNGATVAYEVRGRGRPVVFVHAFPFSSEMWQPQVAALGDGYQVITLDLPGFGGSAPMARPSMIGMADAVVGVLDAAGVREPALFVGISMGGYVLFEVLRQVPERIGALVLADTRALPDTEEGRANRYRTADQVTAEGAKAVVDASLGKMITGNADAALRSQVQAMMLAAPPAGIIGALHAMAARPDSTPDLGSIHVPVMGMVGAEDAITPPPDVAAMVAGIAGATLEVIPGAAHLSNLERPAVFNAALRRFLDDLESRGGQWRGGSATP